MALSAPPFAEQNASHTAALFRQAAGSAFWQAHGVLGGNDLLVAPQATPNMSVQVSPGQAWVQGTSTGTITGVGVGAQGSYYALSDTAATLTIATANGTNPRIDVIYLRILDTAFGDGSNTAILGVVTGTPAVTPAVPSRPANSLDLAHVAVGAGVTSIVLGNITFTGRDTGGLNIINQSVAAASVLMTTEAGLPGTAARNPQVGQLALAGDTYNLYSYIGNGVWVRVGNGNGTGCATVNQTSAQASIAANAFTTITCDTTVQGSLGDGVGVTIPANMGGYYLIDGLVSATNFASTPAEFSTWITVNGSFLAASQGGRVFPTGSGTAWHTGATLGARIMLLSPGDQVRLVAIANTTWATYAANSTVSSWLSVAQMAGFSKVVP